MSGKPARVCLVGPGNVGTEVVKAVRATGSSWQLHSVVVREVRTHHVSHQLPVSTEGERAVTDPAVDVVIDANSDTTVGLSLLDAALRAGKAAVTANKDLAARHGQRLQAVAASFGGSFGYDAAVCAALPVTALVRQHCAADVITEIDGLFSGTCNFILHAMASRGLDLRDAVAEAQRLGYAEPDASDDLSGLDAARKTALVAQLATGRTLDLGTVSRIGIESMTRDDHVRAGQQGHVIRLISRIRFIDSETLAWVAPTQVPDAHPFAQITGADNILRVSAEGLGTITVSGSGAGPVVTAAALLGDAHEQLRRQRNVNP